MSYISQGQDAGRIQIHLPGLDVSESTWNSLEKAITRFKNVKTATISRPGGWLTVDTDLAGYKSPDHLSVALGSIQDNIIAALTAKSRAKTKVY